MNDENKTVSIQKDPKEKDPKTETPPMESFRLWSWADEEPERAKENVFSKL